MIAHHLPILQVLLPLLAAPFCILIPYRSAAWLIAAVIGILTFAVSCLLLMETMGGEGISYELGGWKPPLGIEYRVDSLSALVLVLVSGIGAAVLFFGRSSEREEIPASAGHIFYCLMLLNLSGLLGMTITGDVFNLFVFLEISSLSTYALVALGKDRRALTAAFQYLIIGTVGATFYVIGVGLLYSMTGSLNIGDLATLLAEAPESATIKTALAFMIVGIGIKLGMMPLHFWLPNAYTYAPSLVSAFLAATATKVAIYVMLRIIFTLFGIDIFESSGLSVVVLGLGIFAMFVASFIAINQADAKRLLAFSSLAQVGYILVGFGLSTKIGLTAAVLHIFNHGLMKGALFLALAAIALRVGSTRLDAMAGIGRAMPLTFAALIIGGFSLIGIPLTVGLISKWYLVTAALDSGSLLLAGLILASSLLAVVYVWRIVEAIYFRPLPDGREGLREAPLPLLAAIWILIAANIYFGVNPELTVGIAERSADLLLGGRP